MRILYVANATVSTGGASKSLMAIIDYMTSQGVEVGVVCPDDKGIFRELKERNIFVINTPYYPISSQTPHDVKSAIKFVPKLVRNALRNFKAKRILLSGCGEFNPDIIHENCSVTDIGRWLSKKLNRPYLLHVREYNAGLYVMGLKSALKSKSIYSVTITKDLAKYRNRISSAKNRVIYDGIIDGDDIRFTTKKDSYFLYAGRIEHNKGIDDLLDAYIKYAGQSKFVLPLYVVGGTPDPKYKDYIIQKVSRNGLTEMVRFLGEVSSINDLTYKAVATIIPSHFEGLGRVMPEAMANGSLCIARNTTGTKEQLDNGKKLTGEEIALRFNTVDELFNILQKVSDAFQKEEFMDETSEYVKMINRSQVSIMHYFTSDASGENFLNFYNDILDNHR